MPVEETVGAWVRRPHSAKISRKERMREMVNLPKRIIQVLRHFEGVLSERVWE